VGADEPGCSGDESSRAAADLSTMDAP